MMIKGLSERELQCLCLLARGYTMKESAQELKLSPRTVESYLDNIKTKLNMDRFQLIKLYWQNYFLQR